jgi:transcriptional regulator with XRE-family HTH domain
VRGRPGRRPKDGLRSNALGTLIERQFADPSSPVRSYSELERRCGISREAISRYVTPRADRRRSPTVDTLAAMANAMHLSLEQVCRAAVASAQGIPLPSEVEEQKREALVAPLVATLTEAQFVAVMELLRQMQPRG